MLISGPFQFQLFRAAEDQGLLRLAEGGGLRLRRQYRQRHGQGRLARRRRREEEDGGFGLARRGHLRQRHLLRPDGLERRAQVLARRRRGGRLLQRGDEARLHGLAGLQHHHALLRLHLGRFVGQTTPPAFREARAV